MLASVIRNILHFFAPSLPISQSNYLVYFSRKKESTNIFVVLNFVIPLQLCIYVCKAAFFFFFFFLFLFWLSMWNKRIFASFASLNINGRCWSFNSLIYLMFGKQDLCCSSQNIYNKFSSLAKRERERERKVSKMWIMSIVTGFWWIYSLKNTV